MVVIGVPPGDSRSTCADPPTDGSAVRRAASTYAQKLDGSLSPGSRDSHATRALPGADPPSSAWASRVDFPKPAGAETRSTGGQASPPSWSPSRWVNRGRSTSSLVTRGAKSLVCSSARDAVVTLLVPLAGTGRGRASAPPA